MIAILLALACGSDHRAQKTLTDAGAARALAPAPVTSTITTLGALPKTSRRRAYVIEGTITAIKTEADHDRHIVLSDGAGRTLVAEAPLPACAVGSAAIAAISRARSQAAAARVGQRVRVVGMVFFDKLHGQTGAAPNGVELHPIFSIARLP